MTLLSVQNAYNQIVKQRTPTRDGSAPHSFCDHLSASLLTRRALAGAARAGATIHRDNDEKRSACADEISTQSGLSEGAFQTCSPCASSSRVIVAADVDLVRTFCPVSETLIGGVAAAVANLFQSIIHGVERADAGPAGGAPCPP